MAPSKNDKLVWIALGLGGLYLLSRSDDEDKTVTHVVDIKPDLKPGFGGGKVGPPKEKGTKRGAEDAFGKRQDLSVAEFDPPPLEKPKKEERGGGESPLQMRFQLIRSKLRNLDTKIASIYSLYNSGRARETGTIGPTMFDEMRKTTSVMLHLKTEIERFLQEPGVSNSNSAFDLNIIVRRLARLIGDFEEALTMHTQNSQRNQASMNAQAFLRLYADVRRALRDRQLKHPAEDDRRVPRRGRR